MRHRNSSLFRPSTCVVESDDLAPRSTPSNRFDSITILPRRVLCSALVLLLRPLALQLLDILWRAVLHKLGIFTFVDLRPLWQTIWNIHDTLIIEHVESRLEVRLLLLRFELDERWEQ